MRTREFVFKINKMQGLKEMPTQKKKISSSIEISGLREDS